MKLCIAALRRDQLCELLLHEAWRDAPVWALAGATSQAALKLVAQLQRGLHRVQPAAAFYFANF